MAGVASVLGIVLLVTCEANVHRGHARGFRHDFHLGHLAMARFALYAGLHMSAMRPVHTCKDSIDTHPGNSFSGLCEASELLYGRLTLGNRVMARHARAGGRVSHQLAGFRIRVATRARQPQSQVRLMAVREGLDRPRGM